MFFLGDYSIRFLWSKSSRTSIFVHRIQLSIILQSYAIYYFKNSTIRLILIYISCSAKKSLSVVVVLKFNPMRNATNHGFFWPLFFFMPRKTDFSIFCMINQRLEIVSFPFSSAETISLCYAISQTNKHLSFITQLTSSLHLLDWLLYQLPKVQRLVYVLFWGSF